MNKPIFQKFGILISIVSLCYFGAPAVADAATLSISPGAGTFSIGSTFEASLFLDTEGEQLNAIKTVLTFPPEKLQLVAPSAGQSIIGVWTAQPTFNNQIGRVELQGVMPGGINVSSGLITTLTFRVRSTGSAVIRVADESQLLKNDGKGTEAFYQSNNGVYELILPPPSGPIVSSPTHPDQTRWYRESSAVLQWSAGVQAEGYSYMMSDTPVETPDTVAESDAREVSYGSLSDGRHYFHIRALRDGVWGGTTHYALNIDTELPAEFPVDVLPDKRTTKRQPILNFFTTDRFSGIDHYEIKLVPLSPSALQEAEAATQGRAQSFFIEANSPHVLPDLELGDYDVIVRAYDKAGNVREVTERVEIVTPFLKPLGEDGLRVGGLFTLSWAWVVIIGFLIIGGLGYFAWRIEEWYRHSELIQKDIPEHIKKKIKELKEYEKKYGKSLSIFFLILVFASALMPAGVFAQTQTQLDPPAITTVSRDISNEEIFYAGGRVNITDADVILYLRNQETGETFSKEVESNDGEWFYRHDTFLPAGDYVLWAQSTLSEATSPPSPQVNLSVRSTAIQLGANRISYELIFGFFTALLTVVTAGLLLYIAFRYRTLRARKKARLEEIREAEESLRRGFAILRRDLRQELAHIKQLRAEGASEEEIAKHEQELLNDLASVEQNVGEEIWDIEQAVR